MNSREPLDRASRRGRRDLAPKFPIGPPGQFMHTEKFWPFFQPRVPLKHVGTITKRKCLPLTGFSDFVPSFEKTPPPERVLQETVKQRQDRLMKEKAQAHAKELEPKIAAYRARQLQYSALHELAAGKQQQQQQPKGEGSTGQQEESEEVTLPEHYTVNPFCTLFVARLPYDITDRKLSRVFSKWGPVKTVHIVQHAEGTPRGMAFVEFEEEADMRSAYDRADGMKLGRNLDGKDMRILVDVERGRTVREWLPRRLGGGLGGTRRGSAKVNDRSSGRAGSTVDRDRGGGFRRMDRRTDYRGRFGDRDRTRDRDKDRDRSRRDRDYGRRGDRDRDRTRDRDRDRDRSRYKRSRTSY